MNAIPPTRLFSLLFLLVTVLEITGELWPTRWLIYGTKPFLAALLLAWSWRHRIAGGRPMTILRVGLGFALAGDIFLMIREVDLFGLGLASFLVMQLCYCIVFRLRTTDRPVPPLTIGLAVLLFFGYAGGFLLALQPAFSTNPALHPLWIPVVIYVTCISTMGLMAALRRGASGYWTVLAGALLFIISDSAIAINSFLAPFSGATLLIMSTYAAAQYLIVIYVHPAQ